MNREVKSEDVLAVLGETRQKLSNRANWLSKGAENAAGQKCLYMTMATLPSVGYHASKNAHAIVLDVINELFPEREPIRRHHSDQICLYIGDFNDHHLTTHEDVLWVLDTAIAATKEGC